MTTNNPTPQPAGEGGAAELLPCPFCGETPVADSHYTNQGDKWGGIACGNCAVAGPEVRTYYEEWPKWKQAAIDAWNTRATQPATAPPPHDDSHEDDSALYCLTCSQNGRCGMCLRPLATPTDVAERARRAAEALLTRGWVTRDRLSIDAIVQGVTDIIAAEFGGEIK